MRTVRTIIAGSRTVKEYETVKTAIELCPWHSTITEVVSGCQVSIDIDEHGKEIRYGVDYFGEQWAKSKMIPIKRFPAHWRRYGKPAGPIRNEEMARYADALIAVWVNRSRGTRDMIFKAEYNGLQVFIYEVPA